MNLNYLKNIPFASNDPSIDQPNMQTNTNSISDWVEIDHYGFKNALNLGGLHAQVTMPVLGAIPARLLTNSGILYTKQVTVYDLVSQSSNNLFYTAGTSAKEYQLTRCINNNPQFNLFATNTNYFNSVGPVTSQKGGWTFLPGGMILQYGFCSVTLSAGAFGQNFSVLFPISFNTLNPPYSITATGNRSSVVGSPAPIVNILDGSVTATGFDITIINNTKELGISAISVSWMAIGV